MSKRPPRGRKPATERGRQSERTEATGHAGRLPRAEHAEPGERPRGERRGRGERRPRRAPSEPRPTHDGRVLLGRSFVYEGITAETVTQVLFDATLEPKLRDLAEAASARGIVVETRTRAELDALAGDARHQGVVALGPPYPEYLLEELLALRDAPFLVALDEISDPHNFGAILRSALAFGVDGVIAPRHRSAPLTPVVVRASAGATERIRIARVTNLQRTLADLSSRGLQVVGLAGEGEWAIDAVPYAPAGRVVVVGSEGAGLRRLVRERCDVLTHIPMSGPVESLNASVAAGIALHALSPRSSDSRGAPGVPSRDREG